MCTFYSYYWYIFIITSKLNKIFYGKFRRNKILNKISRITVSKHDVITEYRVLNKICEANLYSLFILISFNEF